MGPIFNKMLMVRLRGVTPPPYGQPDHKTPGFFYGSPKLCKFISRATIISEIWLGQYDFHSKCGLPRKFLKTK